MCKRIRNGVRQHERELFFCLPPSLDGRCHSHQVSYQSRTIFSTNRESINDASFFIYEFSTMRNRIKYETEWKMRWRKADISIIFSSGLRFRSLAHTEHDKSQTKMWKTKKWNAKKLRGKILKILLMTAIFFPVFKAFGKSNLSQWFQKDLHDNALFEAISPTASIIFPFLTYFLSFYRALSHSLSLLGSSLLFGYFVLMKSIGFLLFVWCLPLNRQNSPKAVHFHVPPVTQHNRGGGTYWYHSCGLLNAHLRHLIEFEDPLKFKGKIV